MEVVQQTSVTAHDLIKVNSRWLRVMALRSDAAHLAVDLTTHVSSCRVLILNETLFIQ